MRTEGFKGALLLTLMIALLLTSVTLLILSWTATVSASSEAQIWTEDAEGNLRIDFEPDEMVYICGSGFSVNAQIDISITLPDLIVFQDSTFSDGNGDFVYPYLLNGMSGTYRVTATDGVNSASTTFEDTSYHLEGFDKADGGWKRGLLRGWKELDWVPYRIKFKDLPEGTSSYTFNVYHNNLLDNKDGVDALRDFHVGDKNGNPVTGSVTPSGPFYKTPGKGGDRDIYYTLSVSFTVPFGDDDIDWHVYWQAHLAFGSSGWPGASLHAYADITGKQDIPINVPPAPTGSISGSKWNDSNRNGAWGLDESGLSGWIIQLYFFDPVENAWVHLADENTDNAGGYTFSGLVGGDYYLAEILQDNWIQTYPPAGIHSVTLSEGENRSGLNFGNSFVQALAQWQIIETWAGTVRAPAAWDLIESWTGTVSAPAAWQLIETWTGTVSAPAEWQLIESWIGTVQAPAEWQAPVPAWQLIETWTGTVEAPAAWQLIESWTGVVEAVGVPDFTISVNPTSGSVQQGGGTAATVTITSINNYSLIVSLVASGQPSDVIVSFSPENGTPTFQSTMMINVGSNAPTGGHTITITGTGADNKIHYVLYTLTITAVAPPPPPPPPPPSDTTPPLIPSLLSPADETRTDDNTPTFDWTDVTDSSGVTYTLEIIGALTETGLTSSTYALTNAEALADGIYYWRVRAVDGVGNVSDWSSIWSFTVMVAPPPTPIPATFTLDNLAISSSDVEIGEPVSISVLVRNIGGLVGVRVVVLKINDIPVQTENVALAGGVSDTVIFTVVENVEGTYNVEVDGLTGSFTVVAPPGPPWAIVIVLLLAAMVIATVIFYRRRGIVQAPAAWRVIVS